MNFKGNGLSSAVIACLLTATSQALPSPPGPPEGTGQVAHQVKDVVPGKFHGGGSSPEGTPGPVPRPAAAGVLEGSAEGRLAMNRLSGQLRSRSLVAAVLVAAPLTAGPSGVEPIQWHATDESAQAAARLTGKPIFAAFR